MGMTIDKTIEFFNGLECHTPQAKDAREVVVETMRKYQKIEQIVSDFKEYQKGISCGFGGEAYMQMVSEVVVDGKRNNM